MADKKNHGMICIVVMMAKSSSNFCIVLEMYPLHPKQNICKKMIKCILTIGGLSNLYFSYH